jgi:hypothetical protein
MAKLWKAHATGNIAMAILGKYRRRILKRPELGKCPTCASNG